MRRQNVGNTYIKKFMAFTLAFSVCASLIPTPSLNAANPPKEERSEEKEIIYETININTAEDFIELAANCHIDSWSENKYVCLKKDIDLTGTGFETIAVFGGIFDGEGHTISGFRHMGDGYVTGLFRYIGSTGIVQNLNLKGNISSENEQECIGSICGVNYGTIKNSTFQGTVSGRDTVGGIVGINENTGIISGCSARGRVTGYYSTGGIAGINHGTLNNCTNRAGINDDSAWVEEDDEMGGILQSLTSNDNNEIYSGVDTGGITGYSDGVISGCANRGTVGYEHTGYNIGGIAGRQSGIVSLSTNYGTVYGRKDVGGIVGQMEPFIEINEAESLRDAVNKLHDLIDKTIDDMQATKNVVKSDVDIMQTFADYAIDAGDALTDQLTDFVDVNIGQVNSVSERMEHVLDMLPTVLDNMSNAGDGMTRFGNVMKDVTNDLDVLDKLDDSAYDGTDSRLSLLSTAGGTVTSDSLNPAANNEVSITVRPDDGYVLSALSIKDARGQDIGMKQTEDNKYTFVMTEENVKVTAEFVYEGTFLVESTVGGNVAVSKDGDKVTLKASPSSSDYQVDGFQVGGALIDASKITVEGTSKTITLNKKDYIKNNASVKVKVLFQETTNSQTNRITTVSSTGGVVTVNTSEVNDGDKVFVIPVAADGYVLTELKVLNTVTNSPISLQPESGGKRYSFIMPSDNVKVAAQFVPIDIVLHSNLSGNASYSGSKIGIVSLRIKPDSTYTLDIAPTVTTVIGQNVSVARTQDNSTQVYEFAVGDAQDSYAAYIAFKKQNNKQAVDSAKQDIENSSKELEDSANKAEESIDKINQIVNGQKWDNLSTSQKQEIMTELLNLADYIGETGTEAATVLSSLTTMYNVLEPYTSDAATAAKNDLKKAIDEMQSVTDSLKVANNGIKGIVNYMNAQSDIRFSQLGDGFDATKENFHNQLKALSDSLKNLNNNASAYSDIINKDLRAVNDQLNVVFNLLADRMVDIESLDVDELYEDVSDEDIDMITTGRVDACTNKGIIKGDINIGGITGAMSIDDEDLEGNAAGTVEYEIGRRFITKCLVTNSVNEGYITAKKDGAGGICGYMNHGIIIDCEGYGSVESTEGGYIGGICGESLTIIKRCYALCSVSGSSNVGGIAGYAETLKNCYAMASIEADNGRAGAIAGQIASYEEISSNENSLEEIDRKDSEENTNDTKKVSDNYYVGEELNGIDNVSYLGIAEPISYQDLLTVEQLPTQFRHLQVIYKIEDTYLGAEEIAYGRRLDHLNFPQIPEKEGFYGAWPDVSDKIMNGTLVVEAEYKDNVTVVQSSDSTDVTVLDAVISKPYALVEENFTEDTILNVTISDKIPPQEIGQRKNVVYDVSLENSGIQETDAFALRVFNPFEEAVVYAYREGTWSEIEGKVRGQYLQVMMIGTNESFCVVEKTSNIIWIACIATAVAVVLIVLIVIKKKLSERKRKKLQSQSKKE